jgi:hypothetical protein
LRNQQYGKSEREQYPDDQNQMLVAHVFGTIAALFLVRYIITKCRSKKTLSA